MADDFIEQEVKHLIIRRLGLEDLTVEDIDSDAFLFGDAIGLDSLDALALTVALKKRFDLDLELGYEEHRAHLRTVRTIANLIKNRQLIEISPTA